MTQTSIPATLPEDFLDRLESDPITTAIDFYAARLPLNDKAIVFLADELKLTIEEAAKDQVGFSDRRLGKTLPSTDSAAGRKIRKQLKFVGLLKSTGHESLRGCITFPLFGDNGNITGILGRRIDRSVKADDIVIGEGAARASINGEVFQLRPRDPELKAAVEAKAEIKPASNDLIIEDHQVTFISDNRRYRVRGLERNTTHNTLKVSVMASRDELMHLDAFDMIKSRSRASFIKATAEELFVDADVVKRDIGQLMLKLETLREQRIAEATAPKRKAVELSVQDRDDALELLRDPKLLDRIVADMDACGMVGESTNKLVGYLAATSRKLRDPLAVMIQSSSSAGKTSLMDAILSMMPPEHQVRFSGMTGQSLFYLDSASIRHNILAISEDEGIAEASYALKLLQSDGELRHATVGRDSAGRMVTQEHHVEGPVQIMLTTTAMNIDEELVNRCLLLTVDESRDQTGSIHQQQRDARSLGMFSSDVVGDIVRNRHQNAQRLLDPMRVLNPYASQLTFPTNKTRLRRDHNKYLTLIDTVALLHQHQRQVRVTEIDGQSIDFVSVEPSDIAVANGIAGEVLGRSLDELAPQTRRLLRLVHEFVGRESKASDVSRHTFRFTRRDVREATDWSDSQVHKHLVRLVDLEYLVAHRGKHGSRFVYELLYRGEGAEGQPFLMGLIDPAKLKTPATMPGLLG